MTRPLSPVVVWPDLDEVDRNDFEVEAHGHWLADRARVTAFREAIGAVVRPGDVVADLGCGTGVLSFLARRAGARRVFAVDESPIVRLAERIAMVNGIDGIDFIFADSKTVTLDEPADMVMMDFIGNSGYAPTHLNALCDARDRWLKPGGVVIPASVDMLSAVCHAPDWAELEASWRTPVRGLDVSAGLTLTRNTMRTWRMPVQSALSPMVSTCRIDFASVSPSRVHGAGTMHITRPGVAHGLGLAFHATLGPGPQPVVLTNDPFAAVRAIRPQAFLPFDRPLEVEPGERVTSEFLANATGRIWMRRLALIDRAGRVRHQCVVDKLHALILDRSMLKGSDPAAVPALTATGAAVAEVFARMDGTSTLEDLAQWLCRAHPAVAPTPSAASRVIRPLLANN